MTVDHPEYYRKGTGHEAIDVIEAWGLGFCLGNAVKYIARAGGKGDPAEDLLKARWYIDRELANLGRKTADGGAGHGIQAYSSESAEVLVGSDEGLVRVSVAPADAGVVRMSPEEAVRFANTLRWGVVYAGTEVSSIFKEGPTVRTDAEGRICIALGERLMRFRPEEAKRMAIDVWDAVSEIEGRGDDRGHGDGLDQVHDVRHHDRLGRGRAPVPRCWRHRPPDGGGGRGDGPQGLVPHRRRGGGHSRESRPGAVPPRRGRARVRPCEGPRGQGGGPGARGHADEGVGPPSGQGGATWASWIASR
ncbi:MAG: DUF3310 domain-containing protein [Candidatus Methanomethylophilaceae archaeon]|nr:DUF3310 domain-containing protein [Candidatus Methanomethylophilaceae archaeon]